MDVDQLRASDTGHSSPGFSQSLSSLYHLAKCPCKISRLEFWHTTIPHNVHSSTNAMPHHPSQVQWSFPPFPLPNMAPIVSMCCIIGMCFSLGHGDKFEFDFIIIRKFSVFNNIRNILSVHWSEGTISNLTPVRIAKKLMPCSTVSHHLWNVFEHDVNGSCMVCLVDQGILRLKGEPRHFLSVGRRGP